MYHDVRAEVALRYIFDFGERVVPASVNQTLADCKFFRPDYGDNAYVHHYIRYGGKGATNIHQSWRDNKMILAFMP